MDSYTPTNYATLESGDRTSDRPGRRSCRPRDIRGAGRAVGQGQQAAPHRSDQHERPGRAGPRRRRDPAPTVPQGGRPDGAGGLDQSRRRQHLGFRLNNSGSSGLRLDVPRRRALARRPVAEDQRNLAAHREQRALQVGGNTIRAIDPRPGRCCGATRTVGGTGRARSSSTRGSTSGRRRTPDGLRVAPRRYAE